VVGFAHHEDFTFKKTDMLAGRAMAKFLSWRLPATFFRNVCLHPLVLRKVYSKTRNARDRMKSVSRDDHPEIMDFEIHLWHANDVRTHWYSTGEFLKVDNCQWRVDLPVHHISVKADRYFDNHVVEQHLRVIFSDFTDYRSRMDSHAPSVVADMKTAAPLFPKKLRDILNQP
jgi:hypothetical protein